MFAFRYENKRFGNIFPNKYVLVIFNFHGNNPLNTGWLKFEEVTFSGVAELLISTEYVKASANKNLHGAE